MSKHEEAPKSEASSSPTGYAVGDACTLIVTGLTPEEAKRMIDREFGSVIWDRADGVRTTYPAREIKATILTPNDEAKRPSGSEVALERLVGRSY